MKQLNLFMSAAAVALAFSVSACGVKVEGGDTPVIPENKGIPGPNITGSWRSDCIPDTMSSSYKIIESTFRKSSVSRKTRLYRDYNCTRMTDEKTQNGTFKFIGKENDGSYTIEYRMELGNGWHSLPKEKVVLDNDVLYISDFVIGQDVRKQSMYPMQKVAP